MNQSRGKSIHFSITVVQLVRVVARVKYVFPSIGAVRAGYSQVNGIILMDGTLNVAKCSCLVGRTKQWCDANQTLIVVCAPHSTESSPCSQHSSNSHLALTICTRRGEEHEHVCLVHARRPLSALPIDMSIHSNGCCGFNTRKYIDHSSLLNRVIARCHCALVQVHN